MIIYHDLNETIEKLSKIIHFSLVKMSVPGIMLPFCLVSIFNYLTSESKEQAFRLPYPMMWDSNCVEWTKVMISDVFFVESIVNVCFFRLPFNWRTPWGYLAVILDQTAAAFCTCLLERFDNCIQFPKIFSNLMQIYDINCCPVQMWAFIYVHAGCW